MAPQLLFDISALDLTRTQHDVEAIEAVNPHRGAIRMLDRIIWISDDGIRLLAEKIVRDDEFWVDGHIPGRPIFPGVLMLEAAAQLSSFSYQQHLEAEGHERRFLGFAGIDEVKFRGMVEPGDRLYILSERVQFKPRRCISRAQGVVNGNLVFEAKITGMPL